MGAMLEEEEDAMLEEAEKILKLIAQSKRSSQWVQEQLIGSGVLSDILAVDDLLTMERDVRRRFFGLDPLNPHP